MSLLHALDQHDKNPGKFWGRHSTPLRSRTTTDYLDDPENDEVSLITKPSNSGRSTRSNTLRELRQRNSSQNPIEIKEDHVPRSSTDRKPQEYVDGSSFTIPKTKPQTKGKRTSPTTPTSKGQWLNSKRLGSHSTSSLTGAVKLRRGWSHTTGPGKSSEPFPASEALEQIQQYDSSPESNNNKSGRSRRNNSSLDITPTRFRRACKQRNLKAQLEDKRVSMPEELSDENMEVDQQESKVDKSKKQQRFEDFFCTFCGAAIAKSKCVTCGKIPCENSTSPNKPSLFPTVADFNSSINSSKYNIRYSASKTKPEQKTPTLNTTRKRTNRKKSSLLINGQSRIDDPGATKTAAAAKKPVKRKLKKDSPAVLPELVHISSDEEEQEAETMTQSDVEQLVPGGVKYDDSNIVNMNEESQDDKNSKETSVQSSLPMETAEFSQDTESSEAEKTDNIETKSKTTENYFQRDDIRTHLIVDKINIGLLSGKLAGPVEVNVENIKIELLHDETKYTFKLKGTDLEAFTLSNDETSPYVVIKPTPGWARKMNERYSTKASFIDPGSSICEERQILIMLSKPIGRIELADLVELINDSLCGARVFEEIRNPRRAETELQRMVSHDNKDSTTGFLVRHSAQSPTSASVNNTLSTSMLPRKSYNTRSKDSPTLVNYPKQPAKRVLFYPPLSKTGGVTITSEDIECLQPDTYLNDVIIDFFLKYLTEEVLSAEDKSRTHIFSSFFYKRLTLKKHGVTKEQRTPETMHSLVKTWTKNVDIFSKDFIIVPINECSHWYLTIICYPGLVAAQKDEDIEEGSEEDESLMDTKILQDWSTDKNGETAQPEKADSDNDDAFLIEKFLSKPIKIKNTKTKKSIKKVPIKARPCMLVFDSLSNTGRSQMSVNLRNYLTCEWKEKKGDEMSLTFDKNNLKACFPKVPCQNNSSDCGVYLLQYAESFFKKPITDYNFPINIRDWFPVEIIERKREYLKNLIYKLKERIQIEDSH